MLHARKANVLAFNMALKACEKAGDAPRALRLLGDMEGAGCVGSGLVLFCWWWAFVG
jgi:pentatricopeptide repeat protein